MASLWLEDVDKDDNVDDDGDDNADNAGDDDDGNDNVKLGPP